MNSEGHEKIRVFDSLFTDNHIQMLKLLLPLFDPQIQKHLAVYIKYLELQYTIRFSRTHQPTPTCEKGDPGEICKSLLPYCSQAEKEKLTQIEQLLSSLQNFREMMDMMSMMKDMFPEGMEGMDPEMLFSMFQNGTSEH